MIPGLKITSFNSINFGFWWRVTMSITGKRA